MLMTLHQEGNNPKIDDYRFRILPGSDQAEMAKENTVISRFIAQDENRVSEKDVVSTLYNFNTIIEEDEFQ